MEKVTVAVAAEIHAVAAEIHVVVVAVDVEATIKQFAFKFLR